MVDVESRAGVTVVVPTLNRGSYLIDTVSDLLAQHHRPLEILIVDQSDGSTPELESLVAAHPDLVSHHRVSFRGLPNARNYGWQQARHDLIVYLDDDIWCGPDLIGGYVAALTSGCAGIVGGAIEGDATERGRWVGEYNRWICASRGGFDAHVTVEADHVRGCTFGALRDVIEAVGGFDEELGAGAALHEETDFMLRARAMGYRTLFDGRVRLTHLAAAGGGTRERHAAAYVNAFMHNRAMLIRRHSAWYQWPFCMLRSARMTAAHALGARDPRVLVAGVRGTFRGWQDGGRQPRLTHFGPTSPVA